MRNCLDDQLVQVVEDPVKETFRVKIPAALKRRLDLYITQCKYEISGLGEVEFCNDALTITALYLLAQRVSEVETTLSTQAQLEFLAGASSRGIQTDKLKLWWHSHGDGQVFWSPVDERTINTSVGKPPWWLSIVGNHDGKYLVRLDIFPTPELPLRLTEHGRLVVVHDQDQVEAVRKEIAELVTVQEISRSMLSGFEGLGSLGRLGAGRPKRSGTPATGDTAVAVSTGK